MLLLTALGGIDDRVEGLEAGGDDYLVKPFAFAELLARVNALARRPPTAGAAHASWRSPTSSWTCSKRTVTRGGRRIELQPREFQLLEYLMRHAGRVVTRTMLLESVWDFHFDPKTNIVETHMSRLRGKVDRGFDRELIHTVRGAGYCLRAPRLRCCSASGPPGGAVHRGLRDLGGRARRHRRGAGHARAQGSKPASGSRARRPRSSTSSDSTAASVSQADRRADRERRGRLDYALLGAGRPAWSPASTSSRAPRLRVPRRRNAAPGRSPTDRIRQVPADPFDLCPTGDPGRRRRPAASSVEAAVRRVRVVLGFRAPGLGRRLPADEGVCRRVAAMTGTAEAIIDGDLARRIAPVRGSDDDLDRLARPSTAMLDRIVQLMDSLRQVSNDIAHDLRTPLTRLRQNLERTRIHPATDRRHAAAVERAIDEADGLLATFSALLRIAQIEAGGQRAAFRLIDLTEVVATICEAYAPDVEEGGRIIACAIAPGVMVDGDRELLAQLLANLIENALAHTPLGTEIRVSLHGPGRAKLRPTIEVADDGPGVPVHERDEVLRRFYRWNGAARPGKRLGAEPGCGDRQASRRWCPALRSNARPVRDCYPPACVPRGAADAQARATRATEPIDVANEPRPYRHA